MAVMHISEAEAERGFSDVIARARAGKKVRIEGGGLPVVLQVAPEERKKSLPEAIRLAKERASTVILDDQFERDLDIVICNHEREGLRDPWEE